MSTHPPMDGAAAGSWQAAGLRLLDRVQAYVEAKPGDREAFTDVVDGLTRHLRRLLNHVPRVILDLDGGIPRVNGRALWLDAAHAEVIVRLRRWLAPTRAVGLVFTGEPSLESLERFHAIIARLHDTGKVAPDVRAIESVLAKAEVFTIHLQGPGGLEAAIGQGEQVLWHYARTVAAMESALLPGAVPYDGVRDLARGLATAALTDPPLLLAFPLLGGTESVGRRATDIAVLCAVWAAAMGEPHAVVADWAMVGLLHEAGRAWPATDESWAAGARICALGARQLLEESRVDARLGVRVTAAVEHGLLLSREPFVSTKGEPHPASRVVAAARAFLRGIRKGLSALEVGARLHGRGPRAVDPALMASLVAMVGPFSIGTLVELQNEDLGVVCDQVWSDPEPGRLRRPVATLVERFCDRAERPVSDEAERIVRLGDESPDGTPWRVSRTLKRSGAPSLVATVLRRRTKASARRLGLR